MTRFEPHLQAFQPVEPMDALDVHMPAFTMQQHRDPAVAITPSVLGDLADTLSERRLLGSAGTLVIRRAARRNGSAGSADRHLERSTHEVDHLASPSRRHNLRRITSCSISVERQIGDHLAQPRMLLLELPQLLHLGRYRAAGELLSAIRPSLPPQGSSLAGFSFTSLRSTNPLSGNCQRGRYEKARPIPTERWD